MVVELDHVERRVAAILLNAAVRAHSYPPVDPPTRFCQCAHADDDHHGADGELHCSSCDCRVFRLTEGREGA